MSDSLFLCQSRLPHPPHGFRKEEEMRSGPLLLPLPEDSGDSRNGHVKAGGSPHSWVSPSQLYLF